MTSDIPARLRHLRDAAGLTQARVADATGLHQESIARYERGTVAPPLATLERLLAVYGYRLAILPIAEHSELTALDKENLVLLAQRGHDLAVALGSMFSFMRRVDRALQRYETVEQQLGIIDKETTMKTAKSDINWYVTVGNVVYPCVEVEIVNGKAVRGLAIINGISTWAEHPQYSEE